MNNLSKKALSSWLTKNLWKGEIGGEFFWSKNRKATPHNYSIPQNIIIIMV